MRSLVYTDRFQISESEVYRRQILKSKFDPRTVKVNIRGLFFQLLGKHRVKSLRRVVPRNLTRRKKSFLCIYGDPVKWAAWVNGRHIPRSAHYTQLTQLKTLKSLMIICKWCSFECDMEKYSTRPMNKVHCTSAVFSNIAQKINSVCIFSPDQVTPYIAIRTEPYTTAEVRYGLIQDCIS